MASIWKSNSARISLRSITQSLTTASSTNTSSLPFRFSSVRCIAFLGSGWVNVYRSTKIPNWGIQFVPEKTVFIIERCGKYFKTLPSGLHFSIPIVDRIVDVHSLINKTITIHNRCAITNDNIKIPIEITIVAKVVDPELATYGTENLHLDFIQLAITKTRNEFRKITFTQIKKESVTLKKMIMESINTAARSWGLECLEYDVAEVSSGFGYDLSTPL